MLQGEVDFKNVNAAFTKQAVHFDADDFSNPVLQRWRQQVYAHVDHFIKPRSSILELNAGTGIDAVRFVTKGHRVHATDLSGGMIVELKKKAEKFSLQQEITVQQISFEKLDGVNGKFDYVFSNFGGLNCLKDLSIVTHQLPGLLNKDAYLTLVIMPPVCLWEWLWIFKGQIKKATRRISGKTMAHLEGEYFATYYHSLSNVRKAFGPQFKLVQAEGLGVLAPPPAATNFVEKYPQLATFLGRLDGFVRTHFPFNRCGDHLIVTLKYLG